MALTEELMQIEHRLATGRGREYSDVLADDALVVVPGAVLDKKTCVEAMGDSPGWDDVSLDEPLLIEGKDFATVVYRFSGVRGDATYRATLTSSYRLPERKLFLRQQTPEA